MTLAGFLREILKAGTRLPVTVVSVATTIEEKRRIL